MQAENVVRASDLPADQGGEMVGFTREQGGWEWMSFFVNRLLPGQKLEFDTVDEEMVLVWLGGRSIAGISAQRSGRKPACCRGRLPRPSDRERI